MRQHSSMRGRARTVERVAWWGACGLLAAAGAWSLASRELTDFVDEGPVRLLELDARARQRLVELGLLAAAVAMLAARRLDLAVLRYGVAAAAMACALLLAPPLAVPPAALLALAGAAVFIVRSSDARIAQLAQARHPQWWAAGGVPAGGALVATGALSVWLLRPLIDEGRTLDEQLDFVVAASAPSAAGGATAAAGGAGVVLRQGLLKGTDAFHFGSDSVRLLRGPDGRALLRFEDYAVRNGPDLFVYLTPDAAGDVGVSGALNLSMIKATQGNVNYELPAGVDTSGSAAR
ncbi:MAG: DM13 domain-containing protein [Chloroflexi bacterium]|nr:DM13 domain-containing protein [Chloroflexota bacterium]